MSHHRINCCNDVCKDYGFLILETKILGIEPVYSTPTLKFWTREFLGFTGPLKSKKTGLVSSTGGPTAGITGCGNDLFYEIEIPISESETENISVSIGPEHLGLTADTEMWSDAKFLGLHKKDEIDWPGSPDMKEKDFSYLIKATLILPSKFKGISLSSEYFNRSYFFQYKGITGTPPFEDLAKCFNRDRIPFNPSTYTAGPFLGEEEILCDEKIYTEPLNFKFLLNEGNEEFIGTDEEIKEKIEKHTFKLEIQYTNNIPKNSVPFTSNTSGLQSERYPYDIFFSVVPDVEIKEGTLEHGCNKTNCGDIFVSAQFPGGIGRITLVETEEKAKQNAICVKNTQNCGCVLRGYWKLPSETYNKKISKLANWQTKLNNIQINQIELQVCEKDDGSKYLVLLNTDQFKTLSYRYISPRSIKPYDISPLYPYRSGYTCDTGENNVGFEFFNNNRCPIKSDEINLLCNDCDTITCEPSYGGIYGRYYSNVCKTAPLTVFSEECEGVDCSGRYRSYIGGYSQKKYQRIESGDGTCETGSEYPCIPNTFISTDIPRWIWERSEVFDPSIYRCGFYEENSFDYLNCPEENKFINFFESTEIICDYSSYICDACEEQTFTFSAPNIQIYEYPEEPDCPESVSYTDTYTHSLRCGGEFTSPVVRQCCCGDLSACGQITYDFSDAFVTYRDYIDQTNYQINPYLLLDGVSAYHKEILENGITVSIPIFTDYMKYYLDLWKQDRIDIDSSVSGYTLMVDNPICDIDPNSAFQHEYLFFNGITAEPSGITYPNPFYPELCFRTSFNPICKKQQYPTLEQITQLANNLKIAGKTLDCFEGLKDYYGFTAIMGSDGITLEKLEGLTKMNKCVDIYSVDFITKTINYNSSL